MIDNNVDRMSVNILPFSLDRIVRSLEDQSVDESSTSSSTGSTRISWSLLVRCIRTNPDFFVKVSSQITGNEVLISYRKSDISGIRLD